MLGARVPIMLTSRSDTMDARIVPAALAKVFYHWRRLRPLGLPGQGGLSAIWPMIRK